jgi:hypothetical protein
VWESACTKQDNVMVFSVYVIIVEAVHGLFMYQFVGTLVHDFTVLVIIAFCVDYV